MKSTLRNIILFAVIFLSLKSFAEAPEDNLPLWEGGLFAVRIYTLDYPGAEHGQWREFLLPTFNFRGRILRAEENEGVRARFLRGEMYDVDLSGSGSFAADSKESTVRDGMPNLDWLGEVGPRWNQWFIREKKLELRLSLPFRGVFSTDFARTKHVGYVFVPTIHFDQKILPLEGVSLNHHLAFYFVDQGLADYYFTVDPVYSRPGREAYRANGNYLGERLSTQITMKSGRFFTTAGLQMDRYKNSDFIESPLLRRDVNYSGFVGIGYDLFESEARARD